MSAESPKVCGLNHYALSVAGLDESFDFYQNVLGLELIERREKDMFFRVGEGVLALLAYPGGREDYNREARPKNWGKAFTHFGLSAESSEAVFTMEAYLQEQDVHIIKAAYERWDGASLYFMDPNGYTLEFLYLEQRNG